LTDAFFKASPALKSGDLMKLPAHQAFTQRNTKVSISPVNAKDKIYVEADGEVAGVLPASWEIISQGCRMILPLS
jgi:diacylglycerol kinase family enzyme